MHKGVGENPSVVGIRRAGNANVRPERVGQEHPREGLGPIGRVDVRVVVDLVEVVAPVVVGILDQRAHHVRRRVLRIVSAKMKRSRKQRKGAKSRRYVSTCTGGGGGWRKR